MKLNLGGRYVSVAVGLVIAGSLALSACSSSSKTTSGGTTGGSTASGGTTSAATTDCATGTLNADGSTAQQNAITQWAKDYQTKCSGSTINYSGGGSGQGVTDFTSGKVDFAGSDAALDPAKGEVGRGHQGVRLDRHRHPDGDRTRSRSPTSSAGSPP